MPKPLILFHRQIYSTSPTDLSSNLLNTSHNSRWVRTTNSLNLLPVLKEEESRHSRDTVLGGNVRQLVDVDLEELDVVVFGAQLLDLRGDGLAGTAPLGEEVDEDSFIFDGCVKFLLARTSHERVSMDSEFNVPCCECR